MKNETFDYGIRTGDESAPTDASLRVPSLSGERMSSTVRTDLRMNIALAAWALSALTSPITYVDPTVEFVRSGTSCLFWARQTARRKKISLAEAWIQVRRVFDEAEGFRMRQRAMDARDLPYVVSDGNP